MKKSFETGKCIITKKVYSKMIEDSGFLSFVYVSLGRHVRGDWGDLPKEDKALNDEATINGGRIFSSYKRRKDDTKLWIITEADRNATTVLFPDEY